MKMSKSSKTGVLGGTFDPIHSGHLMLAEQVMSVLSLDRVIFMPTGNPPHKVQSKLASAFDRTEMVRLATRDNPAFTVSTIEIDTPGTSYTYNTLTELKSRLNPEDELYYIVGSDVLLYLDKFYKFDRLVDICTFVVVTRAGAGAGAGLFHYDGESPAGVTRLAGEIERAYGARFTLLPFPEIGISSTMIREKLASGVSVRYMLPDPVFEYICSRRLFTAESTDTALPGYWESAPKMPPKEPTADIAAIRDDLSKRLSPRRFAHTLSVMETAVKIADSYGVDSVKAGLAGLLHDCARDISKADIFKLCDTPWVAHSNMSGAAAVSQLETENPVLLHGRAGYRLARERYKITDIEILSAIAYHTTGSADMNALAKTVFIADAVEPGRKHETAQVARDMLKQAVPMDTIMLYLLDNQIRYILDKGLTLHPDSVTARNSLLLGGCSPPSEHGVI